MCILLTGLTEDADILQLLSLSDWQLWSILKWRHAQAKCVRGSERGKEMKVVSLFVSLMWDDQNMES